MNAFAKAIDNQEFRTENDMKALEHTSNPVVDLFYKIGASRGKDIVPDFVKAYVHDRNLALRVVLWARDIRGGAGERQLFRDVLKYLETNNETESLEKLISKIPLVGRWDDMLVVDKIALTYNLIAQGLNDPSVSGLVAKWMPRKGPIAVKLRRYLSLSPKSYRKMLVAKTNVVETKMCAKNWDSIEFGKLPSLASIRYKKAFFKRSPANYQHYLDGLADGTEKLNAGAVYPYDVLKTALHTVDREAKELILAQWEALPNYVGDVPVLAMVDVSGSMCSPVGGKNKNLTAMDVSISLGLYLADKNKGPFKDCFLTFSEKPKLFKLKGNVLEKMDQMGGTDWSYNTNLHAAFNQILKTAINNDVPKEDMPGILLILSDMQFDNCVIYDDSAIQMIRRKYEESGYDVPKIVFWNLNSYENVPAKYNEEGVALVSGFSPAIMKAILSSKDFTPEAIMMNTIMLDRYSI